MDEEENNEEEKRDPRGLGRQERRERETIFF